MSSRKEQDWEPDYADRCEARRERRMAVNPRLRWCACGRAYQVEDDGSDGKECFECWLRRERGLAREI